MNTGTFYSIVTSSILLMTLSSCVSPSEQFHNAAVANPAQLRTKNNNLFSAAYGSGVIVNVLEIDGKTTAGNMVAVPQPYLLSPGSHEVAVRLGGSYYSEAAGFFKIDVRAGNSYVLRGKNLNSVFTMEVVNTTGGAEKIEQVIKIIGHANQPPMMIPIVVNS